MNDSHERKAIITPRETGFARFKVSANSQLLEARIHDSVTMFRIDDKCTTRVNERSNRHVTAIKKRIFNTCNASST
jgi:hypothetical protein